MKKHECIEKMELLVKLAECEGWNYKIITSDWEKYGKSRTYLKIAETRNNSKHYTEYDYGYYDNIEDKYVPGKKDLNSNYTISGAAIQ